MKITCFLTTYQRPHTLKRAIQSVLDQTYLDFQLIILDNDSQDQTKEIVEPFVRDDSRVQYHCHPRNIGMMKNYAYAFSLIETPYFHFLSDDDYLLPHCYETAMQEMDDFPDIAFCACGVKGRSIKGSAHENPIEKWSRSGYFKAPKGALEMTKSVNRYPYPTAILFRTSVCSSLKPDLGTDIQMCWDSNYLLQLATYYPIAINKRLCAIFSIHDESFTSDYFNQIKTRANKLNSLVDAHEKMAHQITHLDNIPKRSRSKIVKYLNRNTQKICLASIIRFTYEKKYNEIKLITKKLKATTGLGIANQITICLAQIAKSSEFFHHLYIKLIDFKNRIKEKNASKRAS